MCYIEEMKKPLFMRFDDKIMKRIEAVRAASSGPVKTRTDWIEQACYERVVREEEAARANR